MSADDRVNGIAYTQASSAAGKQQVRCQHESKILSNSIIPMKQVAQDM